MSWDEFTDLLSGLNENTPLVNVARIRTETDPEVLKEYTPGMRKMRTDWQTKRAKRRSKKDTESFLKMIQGVFANMAKEEKE